MPWKETTTMEQKIEFICEWRTGKYTITELCKGFEISRPTAYLLINRFEKDGFEGLKKRSFKPRDSPNKTKKIKSIKLKVFLTSPLANIFLLLLYFLIEFLFPLYCTVFKVPPTFILLSDNYSLTN